MVIYTANNIIVVGSGGLYSQTSETYYFIHLCRDFLGASSIFILKCHDTFYLR